MNWYKEAKQSMKIDGAFEDFADSDNQYGHTATLYDIQRYKLDGYVVKIALSKTNHKNVLGVIVTHGSLGSVTWSRFWYYEIDELENAKKDLVKVCVVVKENLDKFISEEMPSALFWPYIREATSDISPEKMMHSNIPYFNYARELRYNPDWRSNLYGTRYPVYQEESYEKYFRKQQRSGKFPD